MASQRMPGPHSGVKTTLTPGDPLARSMSQYGKAYDPAAGVSGLPSAVSEHSAPPAVRGGAGGMKSHPKFGGMGQGMNDSYGDQKRDYGASGDNS